MFDFISYTLPLLARIPFVSLLDLDASGKPGAGLEMGNLVWLGNYDECVGIDGAHFCTMKNIEVTYQKQSLVSFWVLIFNLAI